MPSTFARSKPLQAGKLVAIVLTLVFALAGIFGLLPGAGLTALLVVPIVSLALAAVVALETLWAAAVAVRTDGLRTQGVTDRPLYTIVRAGEVVVAIPAAVTFIGLFVTFTDGPMSGPGAIGLLFIGVGLGVLILSVSLVRTVGEYYRYSQGT